MKRNVAAVMMALMMVCGTASGAGAQVTQVEPVVKLVVSSPVPSYRTVVQTNSTVDGRHYASLWVVPPLTGRLTFSGDGGGASANVRIEGSLDAALMDGQWGKIDAVAIDDVDGGQKTLVLDVRRRTHVLMGAPSVNGRTVRVKTKVSHYSPAVERYIASKRSPVKLQELTGSGWRTVAESVTDSVGGATLAVTASSGDHRYRIRRPDGATVWAAVSLSRVVRV